MNKQRKVLITITYNEMGIIIDTKAEEVAQPQPCEDDPRADVYYLAEKIGINRLYTLVVALRGEPESCEDTISRQAVLDWLKNEWNGMVTSLFDGIKALPSAQPEHEQNTPPEQGKSDKFGVKMGETCTDTISRKAAIDEAEEWIETYNSGRGGQRERDAIKHVISGIKKLPSAQPDTDRIYAELSKAYNVKGLPDEAIGIIGDLMLSLDTPSTQPEQRWIPCSERLPEKPEQVLIYAWNVHYVLAKYREIRTWEGIYKMAWVMEDAYNAPHEIKHDVIAWMPLPEPYTERREE